MTHDQTTPAPVEVTLKPCPFCGGDGSIGEVRYSKPLDDVTWDDGDPVTEAFYGHCVRCSSTMLNSFSGGYRTRQQAAERWNTRTASAPAGEVVAYKITDADGGYWFTDKPENPDLFDSEITQSPLYTHPAPPADLVELVEVCRRILDRGYISASIEEERDDYIALSSALAKHGGA